MNSRWKSRVRATPVTGSCASLDRGSGVPQDKRRDLFKPFMRLSGTRRRLVERAWACRSARQIIVNAGGDLWYEDRDGGGAVFVIELPAALVID